MGSRDIRLRTTLFTVVVAVAAAVALWQFGGANDRQAEEHAATDHQKAAHAKKGDEDEHSEGDEHEDHSGPPKAGEAAISTDGEEHAEKSVNLSKAQLEEFGIALEAASQGEVVEHLGRPAEIKFDGDRFIHVVPRVDGVVKEVKVTQGQKVTADSLLAVLNSSELAELKATYLGDFERRNLALETFEREKQLWEKKISSEKDYLDAKSSLAEAEIALRGSAEKLRALGFSKEYIGTLASAQNVDLARYEILSPIFGTVIQRHIGLGEAVSAEKEVFTVADASTVWVEVTIYPLDLSVVRPGQNVQIEIGDEGAPIDGKIAFVTPHVSEETRTATARITVDNALGRLRPGMFVKAKIEVGKRSAAVRIPRAAIQSYEDKSVVFVEAHSGQFEPRQVRLGRSNTEYVEVLSGISAGENYVAKGSFTLKAELGKAGFADGHNH